MNFTDITFDETGRLRSGWRFAIFCVAFIVAVGVLSILGLAIPASAPLIVFRSFNVLIIVIAALFVAWLCGRRLEGLPFRALGASFTKGWLLHLAAGMAIGAISIALAVAIAMAAGGLRFELQSVDAGLFAQGLATSFLFIAVAAASEEALFRGYPLQTFVRSDLPWVGIAVTSFLFPLAHVFNRDVGTIPLINTALAGVWFGVAYLKTRDLWFCFGLHWMWNWAQGAIFGSEISGYTDLTPVSLLREVDSGPRWLTGDTYGVEGGVVTTIALVVSTVVIYYLPYQRPSPLEPSKN